MDDPNRTLERIGAALHAGDRAAVTSCFGADATLVVMYGEDRIAFTRSGIGDAIDALLTGFDDLRLTLTSRLASKALVVEEAVVSGNHTGNFAGTEPTSRRVCVNIRLSATWGPDSTLQSLFVQGDTRALLAQIAGTDDVIGVTGGLNAIARERHNRALHNADGTNPRRWPSSASGGTALLSSSRRRWGVAAVAMLLLAAVLSWRGGSTTGNQQAHPAAPNKLAATTAASTTQTAPPARPARTALPPIAKADPRAVPKVQAGKQVVLKSDVLFALDSAALTPAASTALTHLAQQVRHTNVTGTIQVNGYTDNLGSIDYDLALSRTRALAVAGVLQQALVGQHVTLVPQGFGHANPIAPNTAGAGRARNRRVAVVLPVPR